MGTVGEAVQKIQVKTLKKAPGPSFKKQNKKKTLVSCREKIKRFYEYYGYRFRICGFGFRDLFFRNGK